MSFRKWAVFAVTVLTFATCARADVKLNGLFADGAVLQQGKEIPIWGTADEGEKVTVKLLNQEASTIARNGRWMVRLKPIKAGGPHTMIVLGKNTITLNGLLVGEVWLCSGQSNMAFQLYRAINAEEAIALANDPELRFFQVPHEASDEVRSNVVGSWNASTPATASNFSAVAYFFGRDLRRTMKVPIGLIDSSVGGTPAEAWTSRQTLESSPELKAILERHLAAVKKFEANAGTRKGRTGTVAAKSLAKKPAAPADPSRSNRRPCGLYNAMIAPLQPYAMAGAIWYQGEANAGRADEYVSLFPAMIGNWRAAWGQGEFPFLFVQIAPHERMTPEIREAQLLSWRKVPRTSMVVITDYGEEKDIHPKAKEPVGSRLALAARAIAYGEKITYSGPVCESAKVSGKKMLLTFSHIDGGLTSKGGELKGFEIAAADGKFLPAQATVRGDRIVLSCKDLDHPTMARYGWVKTPDVNLFNKSGLPATPFRISIQKEISK